MTCRIVRLWLFAVTLVGAGSFGTMLTPLTPLHAQAVAAAGVATDYGPAIAEAREIVRDLMADQNIPGFSIAVGFERTSASGHQQGAESLSWRHPALEDGSKCQAL